MRKKLRILDIVDGTTVDGPGLRTTIYFAGCKHQCLGCHNPQSWDMNGGYEVEIDELVNHIIENDFDVTFSGGDPLFQPLDALTSLAEKIKNLGKDIWLYTGFTFDEIVKENKMLSLLNSIDFVVDGPFILNKRNISLRFRGSENQRIIDVGKSLEYNKTIEAEDFIN